MKASCSQTARCLPSVAKIGFYEPGGSFYPTCFRCAHHGAASRSDFIAGTSAKYRNYSGRCQRLIAQTRSEEHTSELQSRGHLVCRLLLEKKNNTYQYTIR